MYNIYIEEKRKKEQEDKIKDEEKIFKYKEKFRSKINKYNYNLRYFLT